MPVFPGVPGEDPCSLLGQGEPELHTERPQFRDLDQETSCCETTLIQVLLLTPTPPNK